MEGIIRASIGKFITGRKCDDASDALHMLFEDVSSWPDACWLHDARPPQSTILANTSHPPCTACLSVPHMCTAQVIIPSVPKEALVDPNDFRRDRLYCEEMDDACRDHWPIMQVGDGVRSDRRLTCVDRSASWTCDGQ